MLSQPVGKSFYIKAVATNNQGTLIASPSDHNSVTVHATAGGLIAFCRAARIHVNELTDLAYGVD